MSPKTPKRNAVNPKINGGIIFDQNRIKTVRCGEDVAYYTEYYGTLHFWSKTEGTQQYEPIGVPIQEDFFSYVKKNIFGQSNHTGHSDWYKVVEFFINPCPDEMEKAKLMFTIHKHDENEG